jgi:hypothetical protein
LNRASSYFYSDKPKYQPPEPAEKREDQPSLFMNPRQEQEKDSNSFHFIEQIIPFQKRPDPPANEDKKNPRKKQH